ncbi:MAG: AMP-binding protein [Clostridium sp.]|jgi:acyl-coenzyme A synthetase/AMP-(fatty) acid ligase|nr:AMP-binding protein [Clostridium sp.]
MLLYDSDLSKKAVNSSDGTYSYGELHYDVQLIADFFVLKEIREIALISEKSYLAYCVLWAAHIAGVTICCLNVDLPPKRVAECLALFEPDMVIAENEIYGFDNVPLQKLYSEAVCSKEYFDKLTYPPSNNVMYVLFTSGSTGKPKGVAILRKAFEEVIEWAKTNLSMTSEDIVGQYCNIGFDMGLCDVFLALSIGAELVPITGISMLNPGRIIKQYRISCLYAVPTIVDIFIKHKDFEKGLLSSLKLIGFGGAPLYEKHMRYICTYKPLLTVYNTYGPTETTLFTSCIIFTAEAFQEIIETSVCLGNPVAGVSYEIIGEDGNLGELAVIGSHCLAGYLSDKEKINYSAAESKEYFPTGDIVQIKDGNYYFITRKDNQVKIRGIRIDLNGIDTQINKLGISSVSMIIDERLVVFYKGAIANDEIIKLLANYLPMNCLPDEFISLEEIPLNANGKYDRSKLLNYYRKNELNNYEK